MLQVFISWCRGVSWQREQPCSQPHVPHTQPFCRSQTTADCIERKMGLEASTSEILFWQLEIFRGPIERRQKIMMKPIPVQLQFFHVVQVVEQHARAGGKGS